MSKASVAAVGAGIGQGFINAANLYAQHKMKEVETSRVKDLLNRLEGASDIEKVQIYGEIDPKLALSYELGKDKEKAKLQTQQFIAQQYAQDFGGGTPEAIDAPGLGGEQGKVVQPLNQGDATATQTGFTPNAPNMAARNATALNFPGNKNFNEAPMAAPPVANAPNQQAPQPQQQQLTPKQEAQRLRAKGGALNAMQHGAGQPYLDQAKAIEKSEKNAEDQFESTRKYAHQTNKATHDRIEKITQALPKSELVTQMAEEAVNSGNLGAFSRANIAKRLGIKELNSEEGATLDFAIKENLINNLSKVTARATNKWLEQVALSAYAQTGESTSNNLIKLQAARAELELEKAEINAYNQQLDEDLKEFGSEQPFLQRRANKYLEPEQKKITDRAAYKIKEIKENAKSEAQLQKKWNKAVVQGTPLTPRMGMIILSKAASLDKSASKEEQINKARSIAKQLGYTILSPEQIKEYE